MNKTMKDIWKSIKLKLNEISPEINENLNRGITDDDISDLEKIIKVKLPIEFIDFYKVHNGQNYDSPGLINCEQLLSFTEIIDQWNLWESLKEDFKDENGNPYLSDPNDDSIKNFWWNSLWIPITQDGSGNHYCLDLDPTEKGNYGQVIKIWHDDPERSLESNSFKEWIYEYKEQLINNELVYSEDYVGIINKKELDK